MWSIPSPLLLGTILILLFKSRNLIVKHWCYWITLRLSLILKKHLICLICNRNIRKIINIYFSFNQYMRCFSFKMTNTRKPILWTLMLFKSCLNLFKKSPQGFLAVSMKCVSLIYCREGWILQWIIWIWVLKN